MITNIKKLEELKTLSEPSQYESSQEMFDALNKINIEISNVLEEDKKIQVSTIFGKLPPDIFENFQTLDIRIGEILSIEDIPKADKLLKLTVSFGEVGNRTILSGIKEYFPDKNVLLNKRFPFIINLPPRTMKGIVSEGMILASKDDITLHLIECTAKPGSKVG